MKKIKNYVLAGLMVVFAVTALVPTVAYAQTAKESICKGAGLAGGGSADCTPGAGPTVDSVIAAAINLISLVVGVIAVIMIIIGGLKYIMSSGDSNNINSAKNTILYAIIGLVVVAFAQIIVKFVLTKV
jgi:hypothetical protein